MLRAGSGAINAMAAPLSWQEQVAMSRLAKAAGKAEDPKVGSLEKQVSELSEKLRKLEAKLEKPTPATGTPSSPAKKAGKSGKAGKSASANRGAKPAPRKPDTRGGSRRGAKTTKR
jgi:hypothetical protein